MSELRTIWTSPNGLYCFDFLPPSLLIPKYRERPDAAWIVGNLPWDVYGGAIIMLAQERDALQAEIDDMKAGPPSSTSPSGDSRE